MGHCGEVSRAAGNHESKRQRMQAFFFTFVLCRVVLCLDGGSRSEPAVASRRGITDANQSGNAGCSIDTAGFAITTTFESFDIG